MKRLVLSPPVLGFVIGTRAALGFGLGLLAAGRIAEPRRRSIALTLIGIGAATTIPAIRSIVRGRHDSSDAQLSGGPEQSWT
jgi:hypothetical protein